MTFLKEDISPLFEDVENFNKTICDLLVIGIREINNL
jgi:hypothetical protein